MAKIDLAAIDRESFDVKSSDKYPGRFLIVPKKSKHVWTEEERKFRSLLVDSEGRVLSSGFPKFLNVGENCADDAAFQEALAEGRVTFTEKRDGSLIIVDLIGKGIHFRTRGNFDLGDFEAPVMGLVRERYPDLIRWFERAPFWFDGCSLLFEYTAPENRIVVRYDEARLSFLGVVDKSDLSVHVGEDVYHHLRTNVGIISPRYYEFDTRDWQVIAPAIRGWQDDEGVVASFRTYKGLRMVKIKATQYVKLHAIKFKLEGKVNKLAFLLGIKSQDEVLPKLAAFGIDYEATQYIQDEMTAYLTKLAEVERNWAHFNMAVHPSAALSKWQFSTEPKVARKDFVTKIQGWQKIATQFADAAWFSAAMLIYDMKFEEAHRKIMASLVFGESVNVLNNWLSNPQVAATEMLIAAGSQDD